MDCEICGRRISKLKQAMVDGNTLFVCEECALFGKEMPVAEEQESKALMQRIAIPKHLAEQEFDLGLEIVPDFGKMVTQARQAKGLTTKELAMKIFEKESLLHRIENQGIKPSDAIIGKLEKQLGIELKKKTE
ncbi:MAG: multiprotein bridging factor aMBF1 [archaeon]